MLGRETIRDRVLDFSVVASTADVAPEAVLVLSFYDLAAPTDELRSADLHSSLTID